MHILGYPYALPAKLCYQYTLSEISCAWRSASPTEANDLKNLLTGMVRRPVDAVSAPFIRIWLIVLERTTVLSFPFNQAVGTSPHDNGRRRGRT